MTAVAIQDAIGAALDRTGAVLVTGGLGPTRDDITKHAVADLLGLPLEFHDEIWQGLLERFRSLGREPSMTNRSQAEVPRGGTVLRNRWGTAPGLWLESSRGLVIMLPGVPIEMRNLLAHEVVPRLAPRGGNLVVRSLTVRTTSIPESTLAERLGDIEDAVRPLGLAYLPGLEGVDLRLTSWGAGEAESDARLAAAGSGAAATCRRARLWRGRGNAGGRRGRAAPRARLDHRRRRVVHRRPARWPAHRCGGQLGCLPRRDHRVRQRRQD